jgi:hypothetical protein
MDEFVWTDAQKVGGRIFHASCYAEAAKDLHSLVKRSTPEPAGVLGKRKAEVSISSLLIENILNVFRRTTLYCDLKSKRNRHIK